MPDVDGFEVVARLHEADATSDIPILVLTSHSLTEADKVRLNGRVLGIATKGMNGADGLNAWLARVLPLSQPAVPAGDPTLAAR
jgi:CheY-like chemotaxis protein